MRDRPRQMVVAGTWLFLALALPTDLANIKAGLTEPGPGADWRLSLGLSLKTLMTVGAGLGLALDRTLGYCFLLGASLQISLIRVGDCLAVASSWWLYLGQLAIPAADLAYRAGCFAFLGLRWKRLIGEGVKL